MEAPPKLRFISVIAVIYFLLIFFGGYYLTESLAAYELKDQNLWAALVITGLASLLISLFGWRPEIVFAGLTGLLSASGLSLLILREEKQYYFIVALIVLFFAFFWVARLEDWGLKTARAKVMIVLLTIFNIACVYG